jgi:hypothetical protein
LEEKESNFVNCYGSIKQIREEVYNLRRCFEFLYKDSIRIQEILLVNRNLIKRQTFPKAWGATSLELRQSSSLGTSFLEEMTHGVIYS